MVNWKDSHTLTSLTHFDGRNAAKLFSLRPYFSEFAWIRERLAVMVQYVLYVAPTLRIDISPKEKKLLASLLSNFSLAEAQKITDIERETRHDLKAIEYYLISKLPRASRNLSRVINYGLGSEDINSTAAALLLTRSREEVLLPGLRELVVALMGLSTQHTATVMIARTHGVPAGLTTFGKEVANSLLRLCDEIEIFQSIRFRAKLSGEVGTFHALSGSPGHTDWQRIFENFLKSLGLFMHSAATQIVPYDDIVRYLSSMGRINVILSDFARNMWLYVLLNYVRVTMVAAEVGSAGMPHKVNPIFFEGAEGGLSVANGLIETLSRTLMTNRLQRDFSDSTVRRHIVLPIASSLLSYQSLSEALRRIEIEKQVMRQDIDAHAEVFVEPLKTFLVHHGAPDVYAALKEETRGRQLNKAELSQILVRRFPKYLTTETVKSVIGQSLKNPYPGTIVRTGVKRAKRLL